MFVLKVVVGQNAKVLDPGEDRKRLDVGAIEQRPGGSPPSGEHHSTENSFDALSDEQASADIGVVGKFDRTVLGGAEGQARGRAVDLDLCTIQIERGPVNSLEGIGGDVAHDGDHPSSGNRTERAGGGVTQDLDLSTIRNV